MIKIYFNVYAHLKVITHDRGAFARNNNDMIFKILSRNEVLKSCYRVNRVFSTIKELFPSYTETVSKTNSNYVIFGSTPNIDGNNTSFQMPTFSKDERHNLQNFMKLLNRMEHKSNLYVDEDLRQTIEDLSMYSVWDTILGDKNKNCQVFDKKKLSSFDAGLNTQLPVNRDEDVFYLIGGTICYNPVCIKEDLFMKRNVPLVIISVS